MELLIVTGMSGAGKSQAANALEDMGYYCVDNIPPAIIPSFVDLALKNGNELNKMAVVTDARGGNMFSEICNVLSHLKKADVNFKILFLNASNEVLIRRYKENRRKHPLAANANLTLAQAVEKERGVLRNIHFMADYVIDTSFISVTQLKNKLISIFLENTNGALKIQCRSFGFKYGSDTEADLVFDVRCLPNPYYVEELKDKNGLCREVQDFVMDGRESREFYAKLLDFIDCAIPLYIKEGKSQLTVSIGCTGGKHRSVTLAEHIGRHLKEQNYDCVILHRDINK